VKKGRHVGGRKKKKKGEGSGGSRERWVNFKVEELGGKRGVPICRSGLLGVRIGNSEGSHFFKGSNKPEQKFGVGTYGVFSGPKSKSDGTFFCLALSGQE